MNPLSIIDATTFNSLIDTVGDDYIDELLHVDFEETKQLLVDLQKALEKQDVDAFRMVSHSIKSTSNSFGALQYGELAKELEFMGRAGNLEGAPGKVAELVSGYEAVRQALEGLRND